MTAEREKETSEEMREFLDSNQYTETAIEDYQIIFGQKFLSVGGRDVTVNFIKKLNLQKGDRVLDVGCGVGGAACCMVELYGAQVLGIDTCTNMIVKAQEYLNGAEENVKKNVEFRLEDATTANYPSCSFDAIFSREVITHIEDKEGLFRKFLDWLKPGGRLLVNDQWRAEKIEFSAHFEKYIADRKYFMQTGKEQGKILEKVGFGNVSVVDLTQEYEKILQTDIEKLIEKSNSEDKNSEIGLKYQKLIAGWRQKLSRSREGDQRWGILTAVKN